LFTPVRTRRTFEEAVEQIGEAIRAGDLPVGGRLPSERVLAAQMEISRPTLREAIRVLAEAGVIEVKPGPGGGMAVRSDFVPKDLIEQRSDFRIGEVSSVLEARRLFEPRVAQLAALYGTEEDWEALQGIIERQRQSASDRARLQQLDMRFHLHLARATHNPTIVSLMKLLLHRLEIARDMALRSPNEPGLTIAIHERTLLAVMSGDPDKIELAMDEHLGYLERIWEEETGRARLRKIPDFLIPHDQRVSRTNTDLLHRSPA
jgi:GntR family transcriptional regulator, transcriptional repressor for pyruvate dehydrogenase complex